jgi:ABC-type transport system involved in cytochrome c biogenesis permease subunit
MCLYRTKIIFIQCLSIFLILEVLLFLLFFLTVFYYYPVNMRIITTFAITVPISAISSIIMFFLIDERTYDIQRDSLPEIEESV